jgi:hypothetical protein
MSKGWREERDARRQRAFSCRKEAIRKIYLASPNLCKTASFFTEFMGGNKYRPLEVNFTRNALKSLVKEGFLTVEQGVYQGKTFNKYRIAE